MTWRQDSVSSDAVDDRLLRFIQSARVASAGWSAFPLGVPDAESTAWVAVGATLVPLTSDVRVSAIGWLLDRQQTDGSWTFRADQAMATWVTHVALMALSVAGRSADSAAFPPQRLDPARTAATSWVVSEHSTTPSWWQLRLAKLAAQRSSSEEAAVVLDQTIDGYGWARDTFAWVEPTTLALLSLTLQPPSDETRRRMDDCLRLIVDRQAPDGGWNYGNKRVLGYDMPSFPDTTAWAVLGLLAGVRVGSARVAELRPAIVRGVAAMRAVVGVAAEPTGQTLHTPLASALALLVERALLASELEASILGSPSALNDVELEQLRSNFAGLLGPALDAADAGYPLIDTRAAVLSLLALRNVDLLASVTPTPS